MTLAEAYEEAVKSEFTSLIVLLELIVEEKKALTWEDDASKIEYYFQDRFEKKLVEQMWEYGRRRGYYQ